MGRQVRKVFSWSGQVEAHMFHNHTIHRMYRWSTYHSHPTMRIGDPFKFRFSGRPSPGMLSTPDIIKYKIPVPFAFVPVNPSKAPSNEKKVGGCCSTKNNKERSPLASAASFKIDEQCQKTVLNLNKCLKNNQKDSCNYYLNYLNRNCSLNQ